MPMKDEESLIQDLEALIQWMDSKIDGLEIDAGLRTRLSAGALDVAHEHMKSIIILVHRNHFGSAAALLRSLYESYTRGKWLHLCAPEDRLKKFSDGEDLWMKDMIRDLRQLELDDTNEDHLENLHKRLWPIYNDFTHTGIKQIVRRNTSENIEPNYEAGFAREILQNAGMLGLTSGIQTCLLANNIELANEFLDRLKAFSASTNGEDGATN